MIFEEVFDEVKRFGFVEVDLIDDVEGVDVVCKVVIILYLLFN